MYERNDENKRENRIIIENKEITAFHDDIDYGSITIIVTENLDVTYSNHVSEKDEFLEEILDLLESECDVSYVGAELGFGYQYQLIDTIDHSITGGKFLSLCAEPHYLWYKIYLDTDEPGSLTITIPNDTVDLKQFDYESCYPNDLTTNIDFDRTTTVTQIAQTDTSRTLEFTWSEPIEYIEYFGAYGIIDGVDYSGPKYLY